MLCIQLSLNAQSEDMPAYKKVFYKVTQGVIDKEATKETSDKKKKSAKKKKRSKVKNDQPEPTVQIRDSVVIVRKVVYDTLLWINKIPPSIDNRYSDRYLSEFQAFQKQAYNLGNRNKTVYNFSEGEIPSYSDDEYRERINSLPVIIPFEFNEHVKKQIEFYTSEVNKEWMQDVLAYGEIYFPVIESILEKNGLPLELKYLPIVESGLLPEATSHAGAKGLWQFMPGTAYVYKLKNNSYIDESRDVIRSTEAACEFLTFLNERYEGDWLLSLAAYNYGPGNVSSKLRQSTAGSTFWDIRKKLPRETRDYVPKFIAITYLMNYYEAHNLVPFTIDPELVNADTIHLNQPLDLNKVIKYTGASKEHLSFLNPGLKRLYVPKTDYTYILKIPQYASMNFEMYKDAIFNSSAGKAYKIGDALVHIVKTGESLGSIANKYSIKVEELKSWNTIKSNIIHPGDELTVYTNNDIKVTSNPSYEPITKTKYELSDVEKEMIINGSYFYHEIQQGETLKEITEKYPGTSEEAIRIMNELPKYIYLKPGEMLKIPTKG